MHRLCDAGEWMPLFSESGVLEFREATFLSTL